MKRSRSIGLVMMSAGAVFLTASCEEPQVDAAIFEDVQQCLAQPGADEQTCRDAFQLARQQHVEVAPKYTDKAACEADFGEGQCEDAPYQTQGGGSVFMPLMMGYMMGRMMSGGMRGVAPQPLYRSANDPGSFRTADNQTVGRGTGPTTVSRAAASAPTAKRTTVSRGGFGAGARSYGASGG